jgi:PAS domain S-box-containing protein
MSDTQSLDPELAVALVERSPDAMIFAGLDGMIGAWNPAAEHIFGHTAAEAMGQSLDLIIPERFRSAHWTAYDKALESGKTKTDGTPTMTQATHKNGETIYIEVGFRLVYDADGKPMGAMASAREATQRFQRDREMRRELKELREATSKG